MQGPAAHVDHALAAGQLLLFVGGFEGVGQLEAEGHTRGPRGFAQAADEGQAIRILQIVAESLVRDADVIAEPLVEDAAQPFRAEQGGVELDGRVIAAFRDEIAAYAFHLLGRAAVHGRNGQVVGEAGGNGDVPKRRIEGREFLPEALDVLRRVVHAVKETLHGRAPDAFEIVARAHVEDEARPLAGFSFGGQAQHVAQGVEKHEGFQILLKGLIQLELLRPFAIVALVGHVDAGFRDVEFVQRLYGLQLDEARPAQPRREDVLRELRMRHGSHSERRFKHLAVAIHAEGIIPPGHEEEPLGDAEDVAAREAVPHPAEQDGGVQRRKTVGVHVRLLGNVAGGSVYGEKACGRGAFSRPVSRCFWAPASVVLPVRMLANASSLPRFLPFFYKALSRKRPCPAVPQSCLPKTRGRPRSQT